MRNNCAPLEKGKHTMYERFPFARFHPVSRWSRRRESCRGGERRGEREDTAVMRRWRQQRFAVRPFARSFVNERTNTAIKSSSIRRGSCQNFGLLGGRATLSFAGCPGMKIAPLLSLSLLPPTPSHNKYGTHNSVS